MAFSKAMTHILIPVCIFFILGRQIASSRESRSHVLEFLATTLLICNILSFIIESQVFCLAIFIYMFSFCINKTMIYFKFFAFSLPRSRASKSGITLAQNFRATSRLRPGDLERSFNKQGDTRLHVAAVLTR